MKHFKKIIQHLESEKKDEVKELVKLFRSLFSFKYHKIIFLLLSIGFAYYLFQQPFFLSLSEEMGQFRRIGFFIAGFLFSFGFTTPFAIAFFLAVEPTNIFLAAAIGGLGSLIGNIITYKSLKSLAKDEFAQIRKASSIKKIEDIIDSHLHIKISTYLIYAFAGLVLASPLPDEIGLTMLAGLTKIRIKALAVTSFILHALGILIIISLGTSI